MLNGLDSDQDRRSVGPDLGPNCLQRFSADDKKCNHWFIDYSPDHQGYKKASFNSCMVDKLPCFCCRLLTVFQNIFFSKISFRNTIRVVPVDSLDTDQVRRFVAPDRGSNC